MRVDIGGLFGRGGMGESSKRNDPVRYCFVFDKDRPDLIDNPLTEVDVKLLLLQLNESLLRSLTILSLRTVLLSTVVLDVAFISVFILSCGWSEDSADPYDVLRNMLYSREDMFLTSPSTITMCLLLLIECDMLAGCDHSGVFS